MNSDPLTDPSSLIAYRLAHRSSAAPIRQPRQSTAPRTAPAQRTPFVLCTFLFAVALCIGAGFAVVMLQP